MHERDRLATTLGAYQEHLRTAESQRPEELRRPVPDKEELAQAAAISRWQVERLVADHALRLDLPKSGAILSQRLVALSRTTRRDRRAHRAARG